MTRILSGGGKDTAGKAGSVPVGRPGFRQLLGGGMRRFRGSVARRGVRTVSISDPANGILNTPLANVPQIRQGTFAFLATNLTGTNNDLVFTSLVRGDAGEEITIEYVVAGFETPLTVDVIGNAIVVNVETSAAGAPGGDPLSTAQEVMDVVNLDSVAKELVKVTLKTGNDGTGVVTVMAETSLAGADQGEFRDHMPPGTIPGPSAPVISGRHRDVPIESSTIGKRVRDRSANRALRRR